MTPKTIFKSFVAGFLSTLIFHQGILGGLYIGGVVPRPPFNFSSTAPFGVPSVLSLAFFGGLWGILIWALVRQNEGTKHWVKSIVLGAIGPTAVAFLVVFPLKGIAVPLAMIPLGLILNGAWGYGNSLIMKLMNR